LHRQQYLDSQFALKPLKSGHELRFVLMSLRSRANVHVATDKASLKGLKMNDLVLVNRASDWRRLKALVSPPRLQKGCTTSAWMNS
jgi:hypothetical protein